MYFEKGDIVVTGSRSQGIYVIGSPTEHFEVYDGEITTCWSEDIDLNSAPTLIRILNYIDNKYGVDLSDIIE